MPEYKPSMKAVLADLPECGAAAYSNNARPAMGIWGDRLIFAEITDGKFQDRFSMKVDVPKGMTAEQVLRQEAAAYGDDAKYIQLWAGNRVIFDGEPLGEKHDRTPYEIRLKAPASFQIRQDYGASGGEGRLVLYGLNLEDMTGFNAGAESKKVSALSVGDRLNWEDNAVIEGFIPYAGNNDYFVQGQWTYTDMTFNMGMNVEDVAYGIRRNKDLTLEVIPVHESIKEVVTPEAVQRVLKALSGK
jgi:hypothetical protein